MKAFNPPARSTLTILLETAMLNEHDIHWNRMMPAVTADLALATKRSVTELTSFATLHP